MRQKSLLLIGFGGHFRSCLEIIESYSDYEISGIIGNQEEVGKCYSGYKVIGSDKDLISLRSKYQYVFICVGQIRDSSKRANIFESLLRLNFSIPSFISSSAYLSPRCSIYEGVIVMNNATINAGAEIGKNSIVNTGAIIDHDAKIGEHCHISTGVVINGGANIGSRSFIGSGSIIKNGVRIEEGSFIPMGSLVTQDFRSHKL